MLAPLPLIRGLDILAYATGGWFGVRGSIAALRQRKLNVDTLMILAAIGAAAINE